MNSNIGWERWWCGDWCGDQYLWQEEEGLTLEYLQRIHDKHEQWLLAGRHPLPAPVHVLDGNLDLEAFTRAVRAWAADMF